MIYTKDVFFTIFRAQADRVIALMRLAIAIGGCASPGSTCYPPTSPLVVRALLAIYLLFAVVSAWQVWRTAVPRVRGTLMRHVVDLSFFFLAGLLYTSDGPTNPFTLMMPFAILSGTLHWRYKGALWTALACGLILAVVVATDTCESLDLDTRSTTGCLADPLHCRLRDLADLAGVCEDSVRTDVLNLVIKVPDAPQGLDWPFEAALA